MSYILDALKKSEQEREQGNVPDIKTVHAPAAVSPPQHHISWLYIVVISMLLAAGIVSLWHFFLQPSMSQPPVKMAQKSASEPTPAVTVKTETHTPVLPKKPAAPKPAVVTAPPKKARAPEVVKKKPPKSNVVFLKKEIPDDQLYSTKPYRPASSKATPSGKAKSAASPSGTSQRPAPRREPDIVDISELPAAVRNRIPDITFSGHVYSNVSSRRSVIINGKYMREGEFVNADLKLEKITSKGAVFSLGDVWFRLAAMQDWSSH